MSSDFLGVLQKIYTMITDLLTHISFYKSLSPNISTAIDWFSKQDFSKLSSGEHEIKGRAIYASVSDYIVKPLSEGKFEAHVKYIDIQYVISGEEKIGYAPMAEHPMYMKDYDHEKDYALFDITGELLVANQRVFFIFMPQDLHMPGLQLHGSHPVKKLVIKIEKDF